ncbi:Uu.00g145770.m01.CDS01 [Anthostomella pinea]|uniref:Uu.00g145770.m01.CDS01 n=1 Tax=Anthostomella pinea TaxID=933095 RepID=A0AAI8VR23_9PEZI|nr:Uu.00g145770.m01.CDS01 [Anthostomella pinea]
MNDLWEIRQNPRFEGSSQYDRQEVIATITDFYHFPATLPYIQPEHILFPPSGGWPNITQDTLAALGKNDEVNQLLARLLYISIPLHGEAKDCMIRPYTKLNNFAGEAFQAAIKHGAEWVADEKTYIPPFVDLPEWVVSLTYGETNGDYLLLDTTDGTITRYLLDLTSYEPTYDETDPRSWRDKCDDETKPLRQYLDGIRAELTALDGIAHFWQGEPQVLNPPESPDRAQVRR